VLSGGLIVDKSGNVGTHFAIPVRQCANIERVSEPMFR
jgi:hypothetical protein